MLDQSRQVARPINEKFLAEGAVGVAWDGINTIDAAIY